MKKSIIIIAVAVAVLIILGIVIAVMFMFGVENKESMSYPHQIIEPKGKNGFPRIDGDTIYWISAESKSITKYDIDSGAKEIIHEITDPDSTIVELYASEGHIVYKVYARTGEGLLDYINTFYHMDTNVHNTTALSIDPLGMDFEYPHIVYHFWTNDTESITSELRLLNLETDEDVFIAYASWGQVVDGFVYYVKKDWDAQIHDVYVYDSRQNTCEKRESIKTSGVGICPSDDGIIFHQTKDTGPDAVTKFYWFDRNKGKQEKIADFKDWTFSETFNGKVLYFYVSEGGFSMYSTIYGLDMNTGKIGKVATDQWIASVATGTLDCGERGCVWAAERQIHYSELS